MTVPTITVTYDTRAPKAQSIDLYSGDCVQLRAAILSDDGRGLYNFPPGATAELWVSAADDRPNDYFILAAAVLGNFLVAITDPAITDHLPTEPVLGWWVWREADGTQHTRLPVVFRRHYTPAGCVPAPAPENNFATKSDLTNLAGDLAAHESRTDNPHSVTAEQLGAITGDNFVARLESATGLSVDGDGLHSAAPFLAENKIKIIGGAEVDGEIKSVNKYRIKKEFLPLSQNLSALEESGAAPYDLSSYSVVEKENSFDLLDASGRSFGKVDKTNFYFISGDARINYNGKEIHGVPIIEPDHFILSSPLDGDKVGYPLYTVTDGKIKNRAINIVDTTGLTSWAPLFPATSTAADFLLVYTCGCAPTFPAGLEFLTDASLEPFSDWVFEDGKTYLISFSQIGGKKFFCSKRELH